MNVLSCSGSSINRFVISANPAEAKASSHPILTRPADKTRCLLGQFYRSPRRIADGAIAWPNAYTWSSSLKDVIKAVLTTIPSLELPLPSDLLEIIESYLEKHTPFDDSDSHKLHDELLTIYQNDVADTPNRYPIFLAILRQLRPGIGGHKRLMQWWDVLVVPLLDHLGEEKGLADEIRGVLVEILVYDEDDENKEDAAKTAAILSSRLLEMWLKKAAISTTEASAKFMQQQIQLVLIEFGRKRPKVWQ
jgi:solute carrier family 25 protein 16